MQYEVKESCYGVTITSAKFDVVITPAAPLEINMSESARMEVSAAINYIKSGEAEIKAAVVDGISDFNANATAQTTAYDANAEDKLTAYNNNAGNKTASFNLNYDNLTLAFNTNATNKTGDFNDNAATKQAAVDTSAAEAKQWAIGEPSEPSGYSAKYWANNAAGVTSDLNVRLTTIEGEIPAQASSSNQLADKNFVNSSIATNTANFIGTFNSVAELEAYTGSKDDNDYAFVVSTDSAGNTLYNRYKWNGTQWLFEYALNNSSFTAAQWAAINSGITTNAVSDIVTLSTAQTIAGTKMFTGTQYLSTNTIVQKGGGTDGDKEGGELTFEIGSDSVLQDNVHLDVYENRMRIFGADSNNVFHEVLNADIEENRVYMSTPATSSNDNTAATTAFVKNVLDTLYPVGAIYIGTQASCPLATLISGSQWKLVAQNRALWGSDNNHAAGTHIPQGLPDHTHHIGIYDANGQSGGGGYVPWDSLNAGSVIVHIGTNGNGMAGTWTDRDSTGYNYNKQQMTYASNENSIYGASDRVQPSAYVVNVWRRTA